MRKSNFFHRFDLIELKLKFKFMDITQQFIRGQTANSTALQEGRLRVGTTCEKTHTVAYIFDGLTTSHTRSLAAARPAKGCPCIRNENVKPQ